jgi:hypothetical protein
MKKKKTYITQDYGLDEAQFNSLTEGQTGISTQVATNLAEIQAEATAAQQRYEQAAAQAAANASAAASAAASANTQAASNYNKLSGDVTSGFAAAGTDRTAQTKKITDSVTGVAEKVGGLKTNLFGSSYSGLGDELGGAFGILQQQAGEANIDAMTDRATKQAALIGDDGTGGAIGTLSEKVGTGFTDATNLAAANMKTLVGEDGDAGVLGTGFSNLGTMATNNAANAQADREANQEALTNQLTTSTDDLTTLATSNQVDNAAQQQAIIDLLNKYGGDSASYFSDLSAGQTGLSTNLATAQSDLTNFRGAFDQDATLGNQQRARLESANQYQTNEILRGQAGLGNAQAQGFASAANATTASEAATAGQGKDFANIAKMITAGFQTQDAGTNQLKDEFQDRLTTVRNALVDDNLAIDDTIRKTYTDMVTSFDDQGALIARSSLDNGNFISRAIDDSGNLLLAEFATNGDRVAQQSLNINRLMAQLDQFGYIAGTNANMASRSGAGFATPYGLTYG